MLWSGLISFIHVLDEIANGLTPVYAYYRPLACKAQKFHYNCLVVMIKLNYGPFLW